MVECNNQFLCSIWTPPFNLVPKIFNKLQRLPTFSVLSVGSRVALRTSCINSINKLRGSAWNASAQLVKLCTPQCAWLLKRLAFQKWKNWPPFGTKLWTATEKQSSAWMRKGYGNPGRVSFQLGLRFLCHAQLLAELSKQRWIRVATQNSRATVLIIQQTATSSKLQPY